MVRAECESLNRCDFAEMQGGVASKLVWPKAEKETKRLKHNLDLSASDRSLEW